jgi:exodeoxyribonuclease V gamma subunit
VDVGLEVVHASRPQLLVAPLAERLARSSDDPLLAHVVAVPTLAVRDWLEVELARRLGVVAGVRFVLPTELVAETLGLDHDTTDPWRREHLTWHVLAVIASDAPPALSGAPWHGTPARPLTLARHLAERLEAYGIQRPDLLVAWAAGRDVDGSGPDARPLPAGMRWQAELWRAVRAAVGSPSPAERLIAALAADVVTDPVGPAGAVGPLTVVGPWALAGRGVDLLVRTAAVRDIAVLVAAPGARDHPLVDRWGAAAREGMQLLTDLVRRTPGATVAEVPESESDDDQLGRLRTALAADAASATASSRHGAGALPADPERREGDGSVRVHACHGLVRQLEVLRDALLHEFRADPDLRPRDVRILCADPAAVAPLVDPVLGAEVGDVRLPVGLADRSDLGDPPVHDAMDRLLALASSRMDRDEVDTLLALEPIRVACGLDDDDLAFLATAADRLGVRWGVDGAHRTRWGYPAQRDEDTWSQALDRLVAGILLHPDPGRIVPAGDTLLAPADHLTDPEEARVGRVVASVRRLMRVALLGGEPRTTTVWAEELRRVVERLLVPPTRADDRSRELHLQARQVLAVLATLADDARAAGAEEVPLDVRELRVLVRDGLADRRRRSTPPGPDRIAVTGIVPGRGVPAKVIALVGLDEAVLRPPVVDADDLLAATRRPGEPDRALVMRAALLDAVQVAGRLIMTCDGQNVVTGDELPLATVIDELCDALPEPAPDAAATPLVVRHPRHLAHPRNVGLPLDDDDPVPSPGAPAWTFQPIALATLERLREVGLHTLSGEALWVEQVPGGWRLRVPDGGLDGGGDARDLRSRDLPGAEASVAAVTGRALDVDRVASALREPTRAFVRARLGALLPGELRLPPRNLELWVDPRRESALGGEALAHVRSGRDLDDWSLARRLQGGLPPGRVGRTLLERLTDEAAEIDRAAGALRDEPDTRVVATDVAFDGAALRVTARIAAHGVTAHDVRFVRDHPREPVTMWLRLLVAAAAGDPLQDAMLVRRARKQGEAPLVQHLRIAGADASERADVAREVLPVLIDLSRRVRSMPVPLFARASWRLVEGASPSAFGKDLEYDVETPEVRLVMGRLTPMDLDRQLPGPSEHDLPDVGNPAQRWAQALEELRTHSLVVETVAAVGA